jgi:hypothetical protein
MPQTNIPAAQRNAKKLGVEVKASKEKFKKLDVFKNGEKVASIGDIRYSDYLTHKDEERKRLYKQRHAKDRKVKGSAGYYADKILWS